MIGRNHNIQYGVMFNIETIHKHLCISISQLVGNNPKVGHTRKSRLRRVWSKKQQQ